MSHQKSYLRELGIARPRLRIRDWFTETVLSLLRNPGRSVMTATGTVLGAAAFVATLGISSTISWQVSDSFDVRRATEVRVVPGSPSVGTGWLDAKRLGTLRGLNGVTAAGRRILLPEMPFTRRVGDPPVAAKVIGADPGAIAVMGPRLVVGRLPDDFHERSSQRVILLAKTVADQIHIDGIGMAVFLDGRPYTVIGIFDDVERRPEALLAGIVPAGLGEGLVREGQNIERDVVISTAPGAAQLIGGQAPYALRPESAADLRSIAPPDPRTLRREVEGNVTRSSLILSGIALAIGAASIANAATASIVARTPEIGLRRAIGGRRLHIFAQLLGETTALGTLGGVLGVLLGVVVTAGVALANRWTPVLDLRYVAVAVAVTAGVGLLAGLWPAIKAARIQPVAALQR
ncbi:ABC transporter permease [Actinoplanes derwentensis]|uniref:Putative ABC transport system permease protein n=1 Tax=Actinoplanes derwentensis TaxID=113562 RepID=A0A1H2CWF9_9ACTN|nr:ABC transporter permease [Actinoplanes derwentensis]GID87851.1 ABC transporter permease [Actinoplanes derwentensis]SDT74803.1 putative ABC transport system permease protein [Actinoplanes derwentensis]